MKTQRTDRALTTEERMDARRALAILKGTGISLEQAACRAIDVAGRVNRVETTEAIDAFVRTRIAKGLRETSVQFYSNKLDVFGDTFGDAVLDDLKRSDIEPWLNALNVKLQTRKGYYRAVCALLNWACVQDPPMCRSNVIHGLDIGEVKQERSIDIVTPDEAQLIIDHAGAYMATLALMLFTGTRPSEIRSREKPPMLWNQVDFDEQIIRITSQQSKTRSARVLEDLPDNLWKILEIAKAQAQAKDTDEISPGRYRQARVAAKAAIGRWSHDVCRHSFFTYHLAKYKNINQAMLIAGHEGATSTMYQNYRGLATNANAIAFFDIMPNPTSK